jgi:ribonuclease R
VQGLAMSGLVHLSSVQDDFYVFDSERSQLVGRRNRRVIRLGDKVQVQVAKVDSFKKQVDFRLAGEAGAQTKPAAARRPEQKQRWGRNGRPPQEKFQNSKVRRGGRQRSGTEPRRGRQSR